MKRTCTLALTTLFVGTSLSASADDTPSQATVGDVRCLVVASIMGNDQANAHNAALVSLYYLGRIDGRESTAFDLSQAMRAQINLMSPADFNAEGKRCGKELEARGIYLTDVGHKLMDQKSDPEK